MTSNSRDLWQHELWDVKRRSLVPLTTISQREDTIIVEMDLPMVRKQDIRIRLLDEGLEIEASLHRCLRFEGWGTVQRSCEFSSFYHLIPLPKLVMKQGATASFQKGMLRVELKKKQPKQYLIPID